MSVWGTALINREGVLRSQVVRGCSRRPVDQGRQIVYAPGYTGTANCALLGYFATSSGNFLLIFGTTYRSHLLGPGRSETSVINYHYSLRNNPEERSFHLLRGGSLKLRTHASANFCEPNAAFTLLFRILEVPGSVPCQETIFNEGVNCETFRCIDVPIILESRT